MSERQTIMIVDDDAFVRRPLEFILKAEGFHAVLASDGEECLRLVAVDRPDLIFLDVMMPGRDGFGVCHALKSDPEYSDIPIILLSARGQETDEARGLAMGAEEFMTKPYSPSELIRRVRQILESR
jgi:DNA-binding response OmpR family regulator